MCEISRSGRAARPCKRAGTEKRRSVSSLPKRLFEPRPPLGLAVARSCLGGIAIEKERHAGIGTVANRTGSQEGDAGLSRGQAQQQIALRALLAVRARRHRSGSPDRLGSCVPRRHWPRQDRVPTLARGLPVGGSLMIGSLLAKPFLLRLRPETFRHIMDAYLLGTGASLLWGAAI